MFQAKVVEKIKAHFMFNNIYIYIYIFFFFFENRVVYETMWKNNVEPGSSEMTAWRMRTAFWIPKATNKALRICNTYCFSTAKNGCTNARRCYVIRTFSVLLHFS